jgi:hypothetical protein
MGVGRGERTRFIRYDGREERKVAGKLLFASARYHRGAFYSGHLMGTTKHGK